MKNGLICEEYIKFGIEAKTKEEALETISRLALENGIVNSRQGYYEGLLEREREATTGFGYGFAIPHAKVEAVEQAALMAVTFKNPVEWDSMDGSPVSFALVIAVPAGDEGNLHLKILAKLARKLIHEEFRERLKGAQTAEEIMEIFTLEGLLEQE